MSDRTRKTAALTERRTAHRWRRWYHTVCISLAAVIVFCTTYALILPAVTLEKTAYCGMEEHHHTEECYEKRLICDIPENHVHSDACYSEEQVLVCSFEESDGHIHDAGCIGTEQKLICTEDHEHTAACYETAETYICGKAEGEDTHTHGEECYETRSVLTCGVTEENHVHTDACYEDVLVCGKTEHEHTAQCYESPADGEYTWQSEDGSVSLTVSFDGLQVPPKSGEATEGVTSDQTAAPEVAAEAGSSADGADIPETPEDAAENALAEAKPENAIEPDTDEPSENRDDFALTPELNAEEDVARLFGTAGDPDIQPLMTLRLNLMRGDEKIDLSGCTAKVSLTVDKSLLASLPETAAADANDIGEDAENVPTTLSVEDEDGSELTSEEIGETKTTLLFTMKANEAVGVNAIVSNPTYTIQHYLRTERIKATENTLENRRSNWVKPWPSATTTREYLDKQIEFIDGSIGGIYEPVLGWERENRQKNGLTLKNSLTDINPLNGDRNDTFLVNMVGDGKNLTPETEEVCQPLFIDEKTTYHLNPQIEYMNRLYNSLDEEGFNDKYTLSEVWVYTPAEGEDVKPAEQLKDEDFVKYYVPVTKDAPVVDGKAQRHDPSRMRFTNNPSNSHITLKTVEPSQPDGYVPLQHAESEDYDYDYTILITQNTVVRMVFDGTIENDYKTDNVQFFDYDITDGKLYTGPDLTKSTDEEEQFNNTYYAYTYKTGINSAENYPEGSDSSKRLAFGNTNTGTGMDAENFIIADGQELYFNRANLGGFRQSSFGLVQGFHLDEDGYPVPDYAHGISAPDIFGSAVARGKSSYLDDYSLNFVRKGGNFTLKNVWVRGTQDAVAKDLSTVMNVINLNDHSGQTIYSNEFWPMDGSLTHGSAGHDLKFGTKQREANTRQFFGFDQSKSKAFPQNDYPDAPDHNAYFGMSYQVEFTVLPGYTMPMNYWFYGDDDMWVFLQRKNRETGEWENAVKIADVGGVHSSTGIYVDLWEYVDPIPYFQTDAEGNTLYDEKGLPVDIDYSDTYRMTVFYAERGASGSTCYMRFNLPAVTSITPPKERTEALVFEKRLLGTDGNEVPYNDDIHNKKFEFLLTLTNESGKNYEDVYEYAVYRRDTTPNHKDPNATLVDRGTIGTAIPESGKYTFKLKGGEYIVITGIPDKTYYNIEEVTSNDYVTYFQKGNHTHQGDKQIDTLGPVEKYDSVTGAQKAEQYSSDNYNYVRFTNAQPYKTEPDPGPGETVQKGQEITYEIDWRKALEKKIEEQTEETVTVTICDPLDEKVDFVQAKFSTYDKDTPWPWVEGGNAKPQDGSSLPDVTANVSYDSAKHEVVWTLTYPKNITNDIPGVVSLKVIVNGTVNFEENQKPEVSNQAHVTVGNNAEIHTNIIKNPLVKKVSLNVVKTDKSQLGLPGAEFVLYKKGEEQTLYYTGYNDQENSAVWEPISTGKSESDYAWTSGSDGLLIPPGKTVADQFRGLMDGECYLKEIKALDGYNPLKDEIQITVSAGKLTVRNKPDWLTETQEETDFIIYTLEVPNDSDYVLPRTGGAGTTWYKAAGLLIMTAALGMYIGSRKRRRWKRRVR